MQRTKTVTIELDQDERIDLELPGPDTNTGCNGTVRIQVRAIRLHRWFDHPLMPEPSLYLEGRRYRPNGTLFNLTVRATVTADQLPRDLYGELLALDGK